MAVSPSATPSLQRRRTAQFRSGAGQQCSIVREAASGCCQWCTEMAGRYECNGDLPEDVYRRHDNCSCTTTYENGRMRQDVWSKRQWEAPEPDAGASPPTTFTDETRPTGFQPQVLTGGRKPDILKFRDREDWFPITEKSLQSIPNIDVFASERINKAVQKHCREILFDLKQDKIGTEETISMLLSDLTSKKHKGDQGGGAVRPIMLSNPYLAFHNHPSNTTMTAEDVRWMAIDSNCKAVIVIGNNGSSMFIAKQTDSFDRFGFFYYVKDKINGKTIFKSQTDFLKGAEQYGIKYFEFTN